MLLSFVLDFQDVSTKTTSSNLHNLSQNTFPALYPHEAAFWCSGHRSYLGNQSRHDSDFQKLLGSANPCSLPPCSRSDCFLIFVSAQSSTTHPISSNSPTLFWSSPVIWELHINHSGSDACRHCGRSQCHPLQSKAFFEGRQTAVCNERLGDRAVSKEIRMLPEVLVTILERTSPHGCFRSQPHCWLGEIWKSKRFSTWTQFQALCFWDLDLLLGWYPVTTHIPKGPRKPWHWGCPNAQLEGPPGRYPEHRSQHVPGGPRSGWRCEHPRILAVGN